LEKTLVFDDLRVDKSGEIAKSGGLIDRHNGREGELAVGASIRRMRSTGSTTCRSIAVPGRRASNVSGRIRIAPRKVIHRARTAAAARDRPARHRNGERDANHAVRLQTKLRRGFDFVIDGEPHHHAESR
jgi:hypothetical protein